MSEHKLEFGLVLFTCGTSWTAEGNPDWNFISGYAKKAESLGFDSIWVMDHYWNPYSLDYAAFDALTVLASLSGVVHRARLGVSVISNIMRHPSNLATMAASLDAISRGRLDLGIGPGWGLGEAKMLGLPSPRY